MLKFRFQGEGFRACIRVQGLGFRVSSSEVCPAAGVFHPQGFRCKSSNTKMQQKVFGGVPYQKLCIANICNYQLVPCTTLTPLYKASGKASPTLGVVSHSSAFQEDEVRQSFPVRRP